MEQQSSFDLGETGRWVSGVLADPVATARAYQATGAEWPATFRIVTLPVAVAVALLGYLVAWMFGEPRYPGLVGAGLLANLAMFALSLAGVFVFAFVFDYCAGFFKARRNYHASFAALSLAGIPAALSGIVDPIPWVGTLIVLAASVYSLILTYRFFGVFLDIPEDKRTAHFLLSLLVSFVVMVVLSMTIALVFGFGGTPDTVIDDDVGAAGSVTGGVFGEFERQAGFAEQATADRYDPPANGRLSEDQVEGYVRTLQRTAELRERLGQHLEAMGDHARDDMASLGDVFASVRDAARIGTAEMEVVKTGGGNWAEHQWVRNQLEVARVQQDGNPTIEHNFALFEQYRQQIEAYD